MVVGKIAQVIGPVVDVDFPSGQLPKILNALTVTNPSISDVADNLVPILPPPPDSDDGRELDLDVRPPW